MEETNELVNTEKRSGKQLKFLMKQLIKRDFKARYKRTFLGMIWSMLSPLIMFVAQAVIFKFLFSRGEHYISFLIIGNIVFSYYSDATSQGMNALGSNAGIIANISVKKDIFLYSKSIACFFNFCLTLIIMFIIIAADGIKFHIGFLWIIYPIICLFVFNLGLGYILSACQVFVKDTEYFYGIFKSVLIYFSAIFYTVDRFPEKYQPLFYYNPVYTYIYFFRTVILDNTLPHFSIWVLCFAYAYLALLIGKLVYHFKDDKFIYYL